MTKKHCIEAKWAAAASILWVMFISTTTFVINRTQSIDYLALMVIVGICGLLLPWCFIDADTLP